jgi:hypothetical protein
MSGLILVTNSVRELARGKGLAVENWRRERHSKRRCRYLVYAPLKPPFRSQHGLEAALHERCPGDSQILRKRVGADEKLAFHAH